MDAPRRGLRRTLLRSALAGPVVAALVAGVLAVALARALPDLPSSAVAILAVLAGLVAGVATTTAALSGVLGRVSRTLQALVDGVRSFRDNDFSLRLAQVTDDELGELVALYNQVGDTLRSERHDLYQRELLLDTILQGAPLGILISVEGRVIYANRSARDLLAQGRRLDGRTLAELGGQAPREIAEALAGSDALLTVAAEGGDETYRVAHRVFHLNGRPHRLHLVERLTPELRRQEVEVWKRAIRVMSHELNNSLAPIRSLARSARTAIARPEHAHHLEGIFDTIDERATHLTRFLEGYARFARLPRPTPETVDWRAFLDGVHRVSPFQIQGPIPDAPARFDPTQMEQVLINLLKNAHEAGSPPEQVTVAVRAMVDGSATVSVADRGRGMTEDELRQALVPFFSSKPAGAGLGLPLCNEIVEAHGGRLQIQGRTDGGTIVTCWLPA